jgi:hypothetical protein
MEEPVDERPAPRFADDLRAKHSVAELPRNAFRQPLPAVDREREHVRRLFDPEVLPLQCLDLVRPHERQAQLTLLDALGLENLTRQRGRAVGVDLWSAKDQSDNHRSATLANAEAEGVGERFHEIPGDAFEGEFGDGYDLALLTNFFHHFDLPTCVRLASKAHAALAPGGRALTLEFIPEPDRVSPPPAATFALTMLATTASGDAYTFAEYQQVFAQAGFARSVFHALPPTTQQAVVSFRD